MPATLKRSRNLIVTGAVMTAALGLGVLPASAHNETLPATTYNDGYGTFVATSHPNLDGCANYSNYSATLTFPNGAEATITSAHNPLNVWGEFWDGTYVDSTCPQDKINDPLGEHGAGGDEIAGFTGTFEEAGTSSRVCTLSNGTYRRGHLGTKYPELNIAYTFTNDCDGSTVRFKTTIVYTEAVPPTPPFFSPYTAACNSPIAPQTCELGPQQGSW